MASLDVAAVENAQTEVKKTIALREVIGPSCSNLHITLRFPAITEISLILIKQPWEILSLIHVT